MIVNEAAKNIIKNSEGLKLEAYVCPAGKLTIGYGHTGPDVKRGITISKEVADDIFNKDVERFSAGVSKLLKKVPSKNQFGAMVSFAFNVGIGAFADSTMLKFFNEGKIELAANEFLRWVYSNGKVLVGLQRRRIAERTLFLKKDGA